MPEIIAIIPARYASTRFPGKPLHAIGGKPLLQWVWERVNRCRKLAGVAVATDDPRIRACAESFGATVVMTSTNHASGTDRVAEAAKKLGRGTHYINVQGDEPLIAPALIDRIAGRLMEPDFSGIITAAHPISECAEIDDPNVVKAICDRSGRALYFSRSRIPYPRSKPNHIYLRHIGLYAFSLESLMTFVRLKPSPLERVEQLEQLRALENGIPIHVIITRHRPLGVDTPADAARIESLLKTNPPKLRHLE